MSTKGEVIKQRIVAAADELFYRQGYENTSFSDIADVVDISRGNFYYHFKSKEEILDSVLNRRVASIKAMLDQWDNDISDPKQRIYYYIDMQLRNQENILSHGCPFGGLCTELSKVHHSILNDANKSFIVFRDWLVIQLKLLGITKNTKNTAMHLLARGQGIATITNAFEDKQFLQQEVKQLKEWFDNAILISNH